MTGTRTGTPADTEITTEKVDAASPSASSIVTRRPYHKPALRQLGSVRDLTFGSPIVGVNDAMGGRVMLM